MFGGGSSSGGDDDDDEFRKHKNFSNALSSCQEEDFFSAVPFPPEDSQDYSEKKLRIKSQF